MSDHKKTIRKFQKNIYFCFTDYTKAFVYVDHNKLWKILQEMGIPDHLTCLLRNLTQVKKQQLEPDMVQWAGSKLRKKYIYLCFIDYSKAFDCVDHNKLWKVL